MVRVGQGDDLFLPEEVALRTVVRVLRSTAGGRILRRYPMLLCRLDRHLAVLDQKPESHR